MDKELYPDLVLAFQEFGKAFRLLQRNDFVLRPLELAVLHHLNTVESNKVMEIAKVINLAPSTTSGLVEAMVLDGYVERKAVVGDRRAYAIAITDKGKEALKEASKIVDQRFAKLVKELGREEVKTLIHSMRTAAEILQRVEGRK